MTTQGLERKLDALCDENNNREAAEVAYALAELYLREGDTEKATQFGSKSIRLFEECEMNTQEDCAAINMNIGGVIIPSLIHQDVVRSRFKVLGI